MLEGDAPELVENPGLVEAAPGTRAADLERPREPGRRLVPVDAFFV